MATAEDSDSPVAMKLKKMWLKTPVSEEQAAQAVLDPALGNYWLLFLHMMQYSLAAAADILKELHQNFSFIHGNDAQTSEMSHESTRNDIKKNYDYSFLLYSIFFLSICFFMRAAVYAPRAKFISTLLVVFLLYFIFPSFCVPSGEKTF